MAELLRPFVESEAESLAVRLIDQYGSVGRALSARSEGIEDATLSRACSILSASRNLIEYALREELIGKEVNSLCPNMIRYLQTRIGCEQFEKFHVTYLNKSFEFVRDEVFEGYESQTLRLRLRAIIGRVLDLGASRIIVAHNHPSGNVEPSKDDIETTRRFRGVAASLDVELLDHVIVSKTEHFSLRQGGYL